MGSLTTIIIVIALLLLCVGGITIIQKKEQAKALIRQQVAKYRFRASGAMGVLENFSQIPIGEEARGLLFQYIELNLAEANKLAPSDQYIAKNLTQVKQQRKNPSSKIDTQRLRIPKNVDQLNVLIKNLSKLGNYLLKFKTIRAMDINAIPIAINKITFLISEAKICAYIQLGQKSLAEHNYVNAQRLFQTAQKMLDKFNKKDSRLLALEKDLQELINLTPEQAADKKLSVTNDEVKVEKINVDNTNNELNQQDSIFGPKKKW